VVNLQKTQCDMWKALRPTNLRRRLHVEIQH
jgi:hypothetical protein